MNRRFTAFLILFLGVLSFHFKSEAQVRIKTYDAQWKKVETFIDKELPKSALAEVRNIYALAKKEGQDAQVIK